MKLNNLTKNRRVELIISALILIFTVITLLSNNGFNACFPVFLNPLNIGVTLTFFLSFISIGKLFFLANDKKLSNKTNLIYFIVVTVFFVLNVLLTIYFYMNTQATLKCGPECECIDTSLFTNFPYYFSFMIIITLYNLYISVLTLVTYIKERKEQH